MTNMTVAYRKIKLGNPRPLVPRLASPHSGSNSTACTATGYIHATGTQPTDNFSDASAGGNKRRFVYRLSICDVLHFNAPGTDADASRQYDGHVQSRNPPRIKNFSLVSSLSPLFGSRVFWIGPSPIVSNFYVCARKRSAPTNLRYHPASMERMR